MEKEFCFSAGGVEEKCNFGILCSDERRQLNATNAVVDNLKTFEPYHCASHATPEERNLLLP